MNDVALKISSHALSSLNLKLRSRSFKRNVKQRTIFNPQPTLRLVLCMRANTIILFIVIIAFSLFTSCNTNTRSHPPTALGAMSSQTGARGAPRFRGRGQPRADSEPRSDNERRDANVDRKRASEKNNFTVRGGALTRGNPFIRGGDGGARNQAGQKARGTESQKLSESSRENTREPRASNSSRGDRGSTRSQAGSSGERVTRKSKEDAIQGHFVKYLRGGNPVRGRGSTRTNARGGNIARSGTRHHSDRALSSSNSSPNWRDPRHDGGGSYMQNMSELYQTVCFPFSPVY